MYILKQINNMNEVVKNIDEIIMYYNNNYDTIINNGEILTRMYTKLSILSFSLSTHIAELYKEAGMAQVSRKTFEIKTFLSKKVEKIEDKKITDKLAEMIAKD